MNERRYKPDPESGCGLLLIGASVFVLVCICGAAAIVLVVWGA